MYQCRGIDDLAHKHEVLALCIRPHIGVRVASESVLDVDI